MRNVSVHAFMCKSWRIGPRCVGKRGIRGTSIKSMLETFEFGRGFLIVGSISPKNHQSKPASLKNQADMFG